MDQDSYVGFVGVQDEKQNQHSRSTSPRSRSPSPKRREIVPGRTPRLPKPEIPPPAPNMKIRPRTSSLTKQNGEPVSHHGPVSPYKSTPGTRPAKPDVAPPPFNPEGYLRKGPSNAPKVPVKPGKFELNAALQKLPRSPSPNNVRHTSVLYLNSFGCCVTCSCTTDVLGQAVLSYIESYQL